MRLPEGNSARIAGNSPIRGMARWLRYADQDGKSSNANLEKVELVSGVEALGIGPLLSGD